MYRIRFHGRGGQGMKTASRILGTAFFLQGFEVQDAPRYGAERRGAPIFAYVRAARKTIHERGIIQRPDLVVVADDTLVAIPAAGVLAGIGARTVLLIDSFEAPAIWRRRLNFPGRVLTLPAAEALPDQPGYKGAACAAAAARLVGVIPWQTLARAIHEELSEAGPAVLRGNLEKAREAFDLMADHGGLVTESPARPAALDPAPDWLELAFEDPRLAAPTIHAGLTSARVNTGLWRTLRPVIDYERCNRCWWVCSTFCPDGAIPVDADGTPRIDYDHCKGCMICAAQCPPHAIAVVAEHLAAAEART